MSIAPVAATPEPACPPAAGLQAYWSLSASQLMHALASSADGLDGAEADRRLAAFGPNTLEHGREQGTLRLALRQIESPLVLILIFGGIASGSLGEWLNAAIILVVVAGSSLLGFLQASRASSAIARLRQRLALKVRARRDGRICTVDARDLVVGDVIELAAGNLVPADGIVLTAKDFLVTEASLTGESFPVEKVPGVIEPDAPIAARTNAVWLGTAVRSGTAGVLIVRTGRQTVFGDVAARMRVRRPETAFEIGMHRFGMLLVRIMVVMVIFVLTMNQWLGRPTVESLLFAVALAVGLSPELLPAIVSVTLSAGARRMANRGVIVRHLDAIENLGTIDVLCTDKTGTLTEGVMTLAAAVSPDGVASPQVLRLAYLNAAFETGIDNPLDAALVAAGEAAGLHTGDMRKVDEIPYDFIRRRLTIVVSAALCRRHLLITKGAVDAVLGICSRRTVGATQEALDDAGRESLRAWAAAQGRQGFRLLAVATREVPMRPGAGGWTRTDEADLCLQGFLQFLDPPKRDAEATLGALAARGIRTCIVTGDDRHVGAHLARRVGLDADAMLTGAQVGAMSQESLCHLAPRTALFVEIDPQQKERIVRALQHAGHSVGYLGDGINDAPALHAADVGISVEGATDVARESADVVLLRHDLAVLCQGVDEGRRTFVNTLKYVSITASANFGNMVSMALATPLLPFLPLAARQILLVNFLTDLPSMLIAGDRVDEDRLLAAQRWDLPTLQRYMIVFGLTGTVFDLAGFWLLLAVFEAPETLFQSAWFVASTSTELLVVLVLRTRLACWRSAPSTALLSATLAVAVVGIALPYIAPVAAPFGMVALPPTILGAVLALSLAYVGVTEALKRRWFS
ncbi:MAG: magnesium-translocating P-type ATPase [Lautropia sp.]